MIIAGTYSFNHGKEAIEAKYGAELHEVLLVIAAVDSAQCKTKTSREKTMPGRTLYSPRALNKVFRREFELRGWQKHKVRCEYSSEYYVSEHAPGRSSRCPHVFTRHWVYSRTSASFVRLVPTLFGVARLWSAGRKQAIEDAWQ